MTKTIKTALFALAGAGLLATPAFAGNERITGEAELAKLLQGRVAGEPQSCISTFPSTRLRVIDGTALVYEKGGTMWVNRTRVPADVEEHDALVTRQFGTQLCSTDVVHTVDRTGGFYTGNIFLGEFVPYRKAG